MDIHIARFPRGEHKSTTVIFMQLHRWNLGEETREIISWSPSIKRLTRAQASNWAL